MDDLPSDSNLSRKLPDEITLQICDLLNDKDLNNLSKTSWEYNKICNKILQKRALEKIKTFMHKNKEVKWTGYLYPPTIITLHYPYDNKIKITQRDWALKLNTVKFTGDNWIVRDWMFQNINIDNTEEIQYHSQSKEVIQTALINYNDALSVIKYMEYLKYKIDKHI